MLELEELKTRMKKHKLQKIAEATGVHYHVLWRLKNNVNSNPTYKTMKKIEAYLDEHR